MEKGTVKSYDKISGTGMISRASNGDVNFYADGIIGKGRLGLSQGDAVWFEVDNVNNIHRAINVRKA